MDTQIEPSSGQNFNVIVNGIIRFRDVPGMQAKQLTEALLIGHWCGKQEEKRADPKRRGGYRPFSNKGHLKNKSLSGAASPHPQKFTS